MGCKIKRTWSVLIGALLLCATTLQMHAATVTVTNTNDSSPGSLRQALTTANDGDTITFAVTGTITLTSGGLPVTKNLTISGPGADQLSVDGNQALLVLGIFPGKTATISGLTVKNGQIGIWNEQGTLAISNCIVNLNSVGGLFNDHAALTITSCIINGNAFYGLDNHTFDVPPPNDHALDQGFVTIDNTIISGNSGPGVYNQGNLTIINSTLSGNSAGSASDGGGISSGNFKAPGSSVTVINSTISGNSTGDAGGGIDNVGGQFGGTIETGNTILNAGASGENILNDGGTMTSDGYNVCSDDGGGFLNGPGDQINTDPLLGPLQDNGGPTLTHLPLPGSPAIDAGDPNFTRPPFHDQRGCGFYRVFGRRIDIGSVETQPGHGVQLRRRDQLRPKSTEADAYTS